LLAHGAGTDQTSDFMVRFASGLAQRGVETVTFNFVYTEQGRRLPDRNDKLEACFRDVIAALRTGALGENFSRCKLLIGGKSMGGRIASQVAAHSPDGISGVLALGYPLHPPGRRDKLRVAHLPDIRCPMLMVQGTRDTFGTPDELAAIVASLKLSVEIHSVGGGDHSFKVPKKNATPQAQVYDRVLDETARWVRAIAS
jgi:predicted alpha/beta-hydrolase family hydrolase